MCVEGDVSEACGGKGGSGRVSRGGGIHVSGWMWGGQNGLKGGDACREGSGKM